MATVGFREAYDLIHSVLMYDFSPAFVHQLTHREIEVVRITDKCIAINQHVFTGQVLKLKAQHRAPCKIGQFVNVVANEMFRDGQIHWGRIVTLISFCRVMLSSIDHSLKEASIPYISEGFSKFIVTQMEWLETNGWWEGLIRHVSDVNEADDGLCSTWFLASIVVCMVLYGLKMMAPTSE